MEVKDAEKAVSDALLAKNSTLTEKEKIEIDLADKKKQISDSNIQLSTIQDSIDKLIVKSKETQDSFDGLDALKKGKEADIEQLNIEISALEKEKKDTIDANQKDIQSKLDDLNGQKTTKQKELDDIESSVETAKAELATIQKQKDDLTEEIQNIQKLKSQYETIDIPALESKISDLNKTIASLNVAKNDLQEEVKTLLQKTNDSRAIEIRLETLKIQEDDARKKINDLNATFEQKNSELDNKIIYVESVNAAIDKKTEAYKKMTAKAQVESTINEKLSDNPTT